MNSNRLQCPIYNHFQKFMEYICLSESCLLENKIICKNCLASHSQHYNELIQIENLPKELGQVNEKIIVMMQDLQQLKKVTIQEISSKIENKFNDYLKPLLDFEISVRRISNAEQTYGLQELKEFTTLLGENCKIDVKNQQDTQEFIFFKKSFLKHTANKITDYLNDLRQQFDSSTPNLMQNIQKNQDISTQTEMMGIQHISGLVFHDLIQPTPLPQKNMIQIFQDPNRFTSKQLIPKIPQNQLIPQFSQPLILTKK